MPEPLSARPEARFALVAGIAGGLVAAAVALKGMFAPEDALAAFGVVFVPFVAISGMLVAGIWGLALGCVWHALRGTQHYLRPVLVMAVVAAAGLPAIAAWEILRRF